VSTDEVYDSLELGTKTDSMNRLACAALPLAASAAADLLALRNHTHGQDVVVTRCSNNYGPYQFRKPSR
jgi:dTDP-glucose 4,6-dehydratase